MSSINALFIISTVSKLEWSSSQSSFPNTTSFTVNNVLLLDPFFLTTIGSGNLQASILSNPASFGTNSLEIDAVINSPVSDNTYSSFLKFKGLIKVDQMTFIPIPNSDKYQLVLNNSNSQLGSGPVDPYVSTFYTRLNQATTMIGTYETSNDSMTFFGKVGEKLRSQDSSISDLRVLFPTSIPVISNNGEWIANLKVNVELKDGLELIDSEFQITARTTTTLSTTYFTIYIPLRGSLATEINLQYDDFTVLESTDSANTLVFSLQTNRFGTLNGISSSNIYNNKVANVTLKQNSSLEEMILTVKFKEV